MAASTEAGSDPGYDALLADGRVARLRPARPADRAGLLALVGRLSERSAYLRWFNISRGAGPAYVETLLRPDGDVERTVVTEVGGEIVGVAGWEPSGEDSAEIAFLVDDAHQALGIGTLMLEHLAVRARRAALRRFEAEVLPQNAAMLEVFARAGFDARLEHHDGTIAVSFPVDPSDRVLDAVEQRERVAEVASLRRLLAPRSVAVVGSGRPGGMGARVVADLRAGGFRGPVHLVTRRPPTPEVAGVPTVPAVGDLPAAPDLAVVAVPAAAVPDAVTELGRIGTGGVVVLSAGFAEVGGMTAEHELVRTARAAGMRLVGPNCLGVINTDPSVRLCATFTGTRPPAGPVGVLSQSGAMALALLHDLAARGVGVSTFVSVGNKADVSGNDLLLWWEDDPRTQVVVLYLESFGNPRKFARIARRVGGRKPIVAVKAGRGRAGSRAVSSHTAAGMTPDVVVDALLAQAGVLRVDGTDDLIDLVALLAGPTLPAGRRVAVLGNSGGPEAMAADAAEAAGLELPELSAATREALRALLPGAAAVTNPVDMLASASPEDYRQALAVVLADPQVDAVIVVHTALAGSPTAGVVGAVATAPKSDKPVCLCTLAADDDGRPVEGLPRFTYPERAARALARAARYAEHRRRPREDVVRPEGIDAEAARALVAGQLAARPGGGWLAPGQATALLAAYGLPTEPEEVAADVEGAVAAAGRLGFPVAVKAVGAGILHKTEVGGVRLGLRSEAEVRAACTDLRVRLGDRLQGLLVQRMVTEGVDTLAGAVQDPVFGPVVAFGSGGTATDVLDDRAHHLAPLTPGEATALVRTPRVARLLTGHRGAPPVDLTVLTDLLVRIAALADDLPEVAEVEINPLVVSAEGVHPLDVRVRVAPPGRADSPLLRRLR